MHRSCSPLDALVVVDIAVQQAVRVALQQVRRVRNELFHLMQAEPDRLAACDIFPPQACKPASHGTHTYDSKATLEDVM